MNRFEGSGSVHAERMAQGVAARIDSNAQLMEVVSSRSGTLTSPPTPPTDGMTIYDRHLSQANAMVAALEAGLSRVGVRSIGAGGGGWQRAAFLVS